MNNFRFILILTICFHKIRNKIVIKNAQKPVYFCIKTFCELRNWHILRYGTVFFDRWQIVCLLGGFSRVFSIIVNYTSNKVIYVLKLYFIYNFVILKLYILLFKNIFYIFNWQFTVKLCKKIANEAIKTLKINLVLAEWGRFYFND